MPAIILSFLGICILASLILLVVAYGSRRKNVKEIGLASEIVNHLNGDSKPLGVLVDIYEEIPDLVELPKRGVPNLSILKNPKTESFSAEIDGVLPASAMHKSAIEAEVQEDLVGDTDCSGLDSADTSGTYDSVVLDEIPESKESGLEANKNN